MYGMAWSNLAVVEIAIRGPLERSDLAGLYARVCAVLAANPGAVLLCDVTGVPVDAVAMEALARLHLGARRNGCTVHLRNTPDDLVDLATFMGLEQVVVAA
jgi:ABC-type transporter Mla MlaB component